MKRSQRTALNRLQRDMSLEPQTRATAAQLVYSITQFETRRRELATEGRRIARVARQLIIDVRRDWGTER